MLCWCCLFVIVLCHYDMYCHADIITILVWLLHHTHMMMFSEHNVCVLVCCCCCFIHTIITTIVEFEVLTCVGAYDCV